MVNKLKIYEGKIQIIYFAVGKTILNPAGEKLKENQVPL